MAKTAANRDPLIDRLSSLYDAEQQLIQALPPLASCAKSEQLSDVLADHLEETREHVQRLRQAFRILHVPARGLPCEPMAALVQSGLAVVDGNAGCGTFLLDMALISAAQEIERYEITAYRKAIASAKARGYASVAKLLALTLREEEVADRLLTMAARVSDPSASALDLF
jgi:ferritin-like metal-binding protein YciE